MDPDQILWKATYPPYLRTVFFSFFYQNFWFSHFYDFFFFFFCVFVNMEPYGSQNFKSLRLPQFRFDFTQTLNSHMIVMGEYSLLITFLAICQKIKNSMALWNFFVNTGPYGAGNFQKIFLLQCSFDVSQTLWGQWLPWWNTGYYSSGESANF